MKRGLLFSLVFMFLLVIAFLPFVSADCKGCLTANCGLYTDEYSCKWHYQFIMSPGGGPPPDKEAMGYSSWTQCKWLEAEQRCSNGCEPENEPMNCLEMMVPATNPDHCREGAGTVCKCPPDEPDACAQEPFGQECVDFKNKIACVDCPTAITQVDKWWSDKVDEDPNKEVDCLYQVPYVRQDSGTGNTAWSKCCGGICIVPPCYCELCIAETLNGQVQQPVKTRCFDSATCTYDKEGEGTHQVVELCRKGVRWPLSGKFPSPKCGFNFNDESFKERCAITTNLAECTTMNVIDKDNNQIKTLTNVARGKCYEQFEHARVEIQANRLEESPCYCYEMVIESPEEDARGWTIDSENPSTLALQYEPDNKKFFKIEPSNLNFNLDASLYFTGVPSEVSQSDIFVEQYGGGIIERCFKNVLEEISGIIGSGGGEIEMNSLIFQLPENALSSDVVFTLKKFDVLCSYDMNLEEMIEQSFYSDRFAFTAVIGDDASAYQRSLIQSLYGHGVNEVVELSEADLSLDKNFLVFGTFDTNSLAGQLVESSFLEQGDVILVLSSDEENSYWVIASHNEVDLQRAVDFIINENLSEIVNDYHGLIIKQDGSIVFYYHEVLLYPLYGKVLIAPLGKDQSSNLEVELLYDNNRLYVKQAVSDSDGDFVIEDLPEGRIINVAIKPRYYLRKKFDVDFEIKENDFFDFGSLYSEKCDLNNDNRFTFFDIGPFSSCYGKTISENPDCKKADFNFDGKVDFYDLGPFSGAVGSGRQGDASLTSLSGVTVMTGAVVSEEIASKGLWMILIVFGLIIFSVFLIWILKRKS